MLGKLTARARLRLGKPTARVVGSLHLGLGKLAATAMQGKLVAGVMLRKPML